MSGDMFGIDVFGTEERVRSAVTKASDDQMKIFGPASQEMQMKIMGASLHCSIDWVKTGAQIAQKRGDKVTELAFCSAAAELLKGLMTHMEATNKWSAMMERKQIYGNAQLSSCDSVLQTVRYRVTILTAETIKPPELTSEKEKEREAGELSLAINRIINSREIGITFAAMTDSLVDMLAMSTDTDAEVETSVDAIAHRLREQTPLRRGRMAPFKELGRRMDEERRQRIGIKPAAGDGGGAGGDAGSGAGEPGGKDP